MTVSVSSWTRTAQIWHNLYKKGTYWYIDYDRDGERRRHSLKTKVLGEAKERRDAILERRADITWGKRVENTSVPEFWKAYYAFAEKKKAKSTCVGEARAWTLLLDSARPRRLGDIKPRHVERFRDELSKERSANTVNRYMTYCLGIYSWAEKKRYFTVKNPFDGIDRPRVEYAPVRFLSVEERDRLIEVAKTEGSTSIYRFAALCALSGMRSHEAAFARWEWIDLERGKITIQAGPGFEPKSRKFRTIPLSKRLREILDAVEIKDGYLINPLKTTLGRWRTRYEPNTAFATVKKAAGVEWATPHTLRHTFASLLVSSGVSIYKASQWLGHSDLKTTMIYAHLQPEDDDIDRV